MPRITDVTTQKGLRQMDLPLEYKNRIRSLLGDEAEEYFRSLDLPRTHGLRANTLKIKREELAKILPADFNIDGEVAWTEDGLYYADSFPGRHPFYHAGLYYIQEPSAMYPGSVAKARPGEKVLDICAAPGGKSVQLAGGLCGEGLLVSNDISEERVKALVKNLELAGAPNAVVTNESPDNLSKNFPLYFDKILVDAPCSGEGMFRKDEFAVKSWENFKSEKCREMQDEILASADKMLRPGGRIIYSTCTFAPLEDEYTIENFLNNHGNYALCDIPKAAGISDGLFGYDKCARLWPQRLKGEGHFTAVLEKTDEAKETVGESKSSKKQRKDSSFRIFGNIPEEIVEFYKKYCTAEAPEGVYFAMGQNVYYMKDIPPCVDGLKVAIVGTYMGNMIGGKFRPSHPFAMAAAKDLFDQVIDLEPESEEIDRYLKGETLNIGGLKGYTAVKVSGFTVGLAFGQDGMLKNLYPKGWRRT